MIGLDKILGMQFLSDELWKRLYSKYDLHTMNIDVQTRLAFYEGRLELFNRIINGTYEWQPVTVKYVLKDDGSYREVYTLADEDRFVMSAITEIYSQHFEELVSHYCVSYQEGISVSRIVRSIRKRNCYKGYKVDLKKYFDSVPMGQIEKCIGQLYPESAFTKLLLKFYRDDRVIVGGEEIKRFKSLCQGCSFSGFLSNLILRDLDNELGSLCEVYYRYSDDMLLLGDESDEYLQLLFKRLESYGLTVNQKKLSKIDGEFTFLGVKICKDYLRWSNSKRERIRKRILKMARKCKPGSRKAQQWLIREIQKYLLKEEDGYSYFSQLCTLNTDSYDIEWLSKFCKSTIRAAYTGRHNYTHNVNKTSDETLKDLGWVNLDFLELCFRKNMQLYQTMVKHILMKRNEYKCEQITVNEVVRVLDDIDIKDIDLKNHVIYLYGNPYRIIRGEFPEFIDKIKTLWKYAKYYPVNTIFTNWYNGCDERLYFSSEEALKKILIMILSVEYEMNGFYEVHDDLVLIRDWFRLEV